MNTDSIEFASRTDIGRVRVANEDSCGAARRSDNAQLMVVADGMGGHRGGATASRTAVETIEAHFEHSRTADLGDTLLDSIETANARIHRLAGQDAELEGMGTTVVALALDDQGRGAIAHVGDSRGYRLHDRQLLALTSDHSVVNELLRHGVLTEEEAAAHPRRNEILRSVGVHPYVQVEISAVEIEPGDRILLCSDGLSGLVSDDEIGSILGADPPVEAIDRLVQLANERGGVDNITVQILAFGDSAPAGDETRARRPTQQDENVLDAKRPARGRRRLFLGILVAATLVGLWLRG